MKDPQAALFVLGGLRRVFCLSVWLLIIAFLASWDFVIRYPRQVLLFYDFAPWRRLLIRDNQLTVGVLVNVMFLGLALCNHSQTKKKGETKCKIQSWTSPFNADSTGL